MPEKSSEPFNLEEPALRALAKALAPYIAEELGLPAPSRSADGSENSWSDDQIRQYVQELTPEVAARAISFFGLLKQGSLSSKTLDRLEEPGHNPARPPDDPDRPWLGEADARHLAGILTTPLSRRAAALGFAAPFEREVRRGETIWRDYLGLAERLEQELRRRLSGEAERRKTEETSPLDKVEVVDDRPAPMAVLVLAPEYASDLKNEATWFSTLRDMKRGDRAVIYRTREDRGVVALFDVTDESTEWDNQWGWGAEGRVIALSSPISRTELMRDRDLRPVFERPQGRRYLPPRAQRALVPLLRKRLGGELPRVGPIAGPDDRFRRDSSS